MKHARTSLRSTRLLALAVACGCADAKHEGIPVSTTADASVNVAIDGGAGAGAETWTTPRQLVDVGADTPLRTIVDSRGEVIVSWLRDEDRAGDAGVQPRSLWWGRYLPRTQEWQPGGRIDRGSGSVLDWRLVALAGGDWVAIWSGTGGARSRRFVHATGKLADEQLGNDVDRARCIAVTPAGHHVVTVFASEARVAASRYDTDIDAWEDAVVLQSTDSELCPSVQADTHGNLLAIWGSRGATSLRFAMLSWSRFDGAAETWSDAQELSRNEYSSYDHATLLIEPAGDAIAAWVEGQSMVSTAFYDAKEQSWSVARHDGRFMQQGITVDAGPSRRIASLLLRDDVHIRADLVWTETPPDGFDTLDLETQNLDYGTGWSPVATQVAGATLSPPTRYDAFATNVGPELASNSMSDAVLVWTVPADEQNHGLIVVRRQGPRGYWGKTKHLEDERGRAYRGAVVQAPVGVVTEDDTAVVFWPAGVARDGDAAPGSAPSLWVSQTQ